MPTLQTKLTALSQYRIDEPVVLYFELTNTSSEDILLLSWFTPMEGLRSDCLRVIHEGARVAYDGPLLKRGRPSRNSFLLVPAGQSISASFELSSGYSIAKPGKYEVQVATRVQGIQSPASEVALLGKLASFGREADHHQIESVAVTFSVQGEGKPWLTAGAHARLVESQQASLGRLTEGKTAPEGEMTNVPTLLAAKEPKFTGGDANKKAVAKAAHLKAYDLFAASIGRLANDDNYVEWFGAHTANRFAKVKATHTTAKGKMETKEFTYDLAGNSDCTSDTFAYTFFDSATIWLCALFWTSGTSGQDSQGGTVLHEHTHTSSHTTDVDDTYGPEACRNLAKGFPDKAIMNADNYQYYAEKL